MRKTDISDTLYYRFRWRLGLLIFAIFLTGVLSGFVAKNLIVLSLIGKDKDVLVLEADK